MHLRPGQYILIGFLLSLSGVILPLLMVVNVLQSTFFLNFFSYIASIVGLVLGVYGAASYVRMKKK